MKKKVLMTGKNSYVGTSFAKFAEGKYDIDLISVRDDNWKQMDFSQYDVLLHVAALVHKKERPEMEEEYFKVNTELTKKLAEKAKNEGIKQFIFLSTMSVYGLEGSLKEVVTIDKNTKENPTSFYGKSKLAAEKELFDIEDDNFIVTILRPPMIYGKDCPGNYARLEKLAKVTPIFPKIENKRSAVEINKLCDYVCEYIDNKTAGILLPQDNQYMNTSEEVYKIGIQKNKKIYLSKFLGKMTKMTSNLGIVKKVFGNLVYEGDEVI